MPIDAGPVAPMVKGSTYGVIRMHYHQSRILVLLLVVTLGTSACSGTTGASQKPTPTALFLSRGTPITVAQPALTPTAAVRAPTGPSAKDAPSSQLPQTTAIPTQTPTTAGLLVLGDVPTVTLFEQPARASRLVATLPGSEVMWARAKDTGSQWLLVAFGEDDRNGWVELAAVRVFGDPETLPSSNEVAPAVAKATSAESGDRATMPGRITSGPLNVRNGPGLDQPMIGQLALGDSVSVKGRSTDGEWLAILWESGEGWIAARFASLESSVGSLPAIAVASTGVPAPTQSLAGTIVIASSIGGEIVAVNADGSNLRRLSDGMDPALSPDGSRMAFARWSGQQGIYVIELGTGTETLVAGATHPRHPTWSSDGLRLAFSHTTSSYTCYGTPLGCVDESVIRSYLGGQECAETPSGTICISDFPIHTLEKTGLVQVNLADLSRRDLPSEPPDARSPAWRPGHEEILYQGKQGLQVTVPDDNTRPLVANTDMGSPAWSPDGQQIAIQIYSHDHTDLFLLDASGHTIRRLTAPVDAFTKAPNNVAPAWSPDGSQLIFLSDRDGAWRVYRMQADGSNQQLLLAEVIGKIDVRYEFSSENALSWSR